MGSGAASRAWIGYAKVSDNFAYLCVSSRSPETPLSATQSVGFSDSGAPVDIVANYRKQQLC